MKLKWVIVVETLIILALATALVFNQVHDPRVEKEGKKQGLLSLRVYAGLLEPKSHLIFNFEPLQTNLLKFIKKNQLNVSVYVLNLRDGASMGINEEQQFYPASLNKLYTAILIIKRIEHGELRFDTMVPLRDDDRRQDFGDLYLSNATELPLRQVFEKMLRDSDNTAFEMLQPYVNEMSARDLSFFTFYLDYYSQENSLPKKGRKQIYLDQINVKAMANIFSSLYLSALLEPEHSEYILSLLTDTVFNLTEVANLPADVIVAHKFGARYSNTGKDFNDCGILYTGMTRIFYCVVTRDLEASDAMKVIGLIVNSIYNYVVEAKSVFKQAQW